MLGLLILSALAAVTIGSMDLSIRDVYSVIGYELFHLDLSLIHISVYNGINRLG